MAQPVGSSGGTAPVKPGPGASPEDQEGLVDALRRGDPAAIERLVRESTPPLMAAARRILGNDEDAKDAVREAFFHALRSLHGLQRGARLSTWLHRIAVEMSLMKLHA